MDSWGPGGWATDGHLLWASFALLALKMGQLDEVCKRVQKMSEHDFIKLSQEQPASGKLQIIFSHWGFVGMCNCVFCAVVTGLNLFRCSFLSSISPYWHDALVV